jgi:hypothetical protein
MGAYLIDIVFILSLAGGVYLGFKAKEVCREKNNGKHRIKESPLP